MDPERINELTRHALTSATTIMPFIKHGSMSVERQQTGEQTPCEHTTETNTITTDLSTNQSIDIEYGTITPQSRHATCQEKTAKVTKVKQRCKGETEMSIGVAAKIGHPS